jgi:beta-lactam-binding protein with PASTA domain
MRTFLAFLKSRLFLYNLLAAVLLLSGAFYLFTERLEAYTHHGETLTVPDFSGLTLDQVKGLCEDKNLQYQVFDSVYYPSKGRHTVVEQTPVALSKVKNNRTIYLTINSARAPKVSLPDLQDASLRQARLILESKGLKVGELEYKPDPAQNAVLKMKVRGGEAQAGDMLRKGTKVDLVLGDGLKTEPTDVPDLMGRTLEDVRFLLRAYDLTLGRVQYADDIENRSTAVVYLQRPAPDADQKVGKGTAIDVYLTDPTDSLKAYQPPDSLVGDTVP